MLVLTRGINERLIIGDREIVLTVLNIRGNQVRLGIEAPKDIAVHREEIYERIHGNAPQADSSETDRQDEDA